METIYPRKMTIKIIGRDEEIISEETQKTFLTRAQLSDTVRLVIEEDNDLREKVVKVEIF
ncbi:hypothetical protein [Bacillus wiedmannii]|uniref:hypothetical protein n=1 Tax=Bacillus wiedmannii TaxID=1890302 RepID=UPI000CD8EB94|nr:hypothetical protein [Bacillus wiedmannii]MBG9832132.1 hypothetical protein [Bacillus wiedmannii]UOB95754.1 hypothetical protein BTI679_30970 [Bacillus wiedmannii]